MKKELTKTKRDRKNCKYFYVGILTDKEKCKYLDGLPCNKVCNFYVPVINANT